MSDPIARDSDRRSGAGDRRKTGDRRTSIGWLGHVRFASWPEQKIQFFTRYLFLVLAFVFFGLSTPVHPPIWSRGTLWAFYVAYALINTINLWHARRQPYSVARYRFAMWFDIIGVSATVLNDPYDIPPTLIVFILVVLGNGMRYGMPLFAEGLAGSFIGAIGALALRDFAFGPGMLFLTLFAGIVLIYSYFLMSRIESSRRDMEVRSNTDALTGLLNRRALYEAAERLFPLIAGGKNRVVVMFADLDKFKLVNDQHGHAFGDKVIGEIGEVLRAAVRAADVAARYGGDEFVLLMPNTTLDEADRIAARIRDTIHAKAREMGQEFGVTIAIGEAPTHGMRLDDVLRHLDAALYQSKSQVGKGGIRRADIAP